MTKDIGLVRLKDLTIKKEAEGNGQIPLENAQFILYGPFEPGSEITEQDLTAANEAGNVQTDIQEMCIRDRFEIIKWGIQGTEQKRMDHTYFTGFNLGDDLSKIHTGDDGVLIQGTNGKVIPKTKTIMGTYMTDTTEDGVAGHVFSNFVRYGNIYLFKEAYVPVGWKILPSYENGILLVPDEGVTENEISQDVYKRQVLRYGCF